MSMGLKKRGVVFAAGAASAAASLGVGAAYASDPPNFQGYEPGDPQTWVHSNGSSLTIKPNGSAYGTGTIAGLSESNFGLLDPATAGFAYGQYATAGLNRLPPGDHALGFSSWPGQTYQFQAFIYLSNQWGAASANNNNDIAWFPIDVMEDQGGGNFTYAHTQNFRVKRTADNVAAGTFGLYEAATGNVGVGYPPGAGTIPLITVPGDAWYGIHEVYEEDASGFGKVTGSWTNASGTVLGSFTTVFNGQGVPSLPIASFGGFGDIFPNFIDTSTNIDELGIPLDNVAVLLGSQMVIPPLTPIPEPASLAVLAAGGGLLVSRRRQRLE